MLEEMRKIDDYDTEIHGTLDNSEKRSTFGDRYWPQNAKQEGHKVSKTFLCNIWGKWHERPYAGGVSMRSRNGATDTLSMVK